MTILRLTLSFFKIEVAFFNMVGWWVKIFEIKRGSHFFIYTTKLFIFVVAIFRGHTQIFQYQRFIFKIKIFINRTFSKSMNFFKIKDQSFNFLFLLFLFFRFRRRHFYQKPRKTKINFVITITLFYLLSSPTFTKNQPKKNPKSW